MTNSHFYWKFMAARKRKHMSNLPDCLHSPSSCPRDQVNREDP